MILMEILNGWVLREQLHLCGVLLVAVCPQRQVLARIPNSETFSKLVATLEGSILDRTSHGN